MWWYSWWYTSLISVLFVIHHRDRPLTAVVYWIAENGVKLVARSLIAWYRSPAKGLSLSLMMMANGTFADDQL